MRIIFNFFFILKLGYEPLQGFPPVPEAVFVKYVFLESQQQSVSSNLNFTMDFFKPKIKVLIIGYFL